MQGMTYRMMESALMEKALELGFCDIPSEVKIEMERGFVHEEIQYELECKLESLAEDAERLTLCCEVEPYDDDEFCPECYEKDPCIYLSI